MEECEAEVLLRVHGDVLSSLDPLTDQEKQLVLKDIAARLGLRLIALTELERKDAELIEQRKITTVLEDHIRKLREEI